MGVGAVFPTLVLLSLKDTFLPTSDPQSKMGLKLSSIKNDQEHFYTREINSRGVSHSLHNLL